MMMSEDGAFFKRLEIYFDEQQANVAVFSVALQLTRMRGEHFLDELEDTLLKARKISSLNNVPSATQLWAVEDHIKRNRCQRPTSRGSGFPAILAVIR
jgi:hypothetical protein